MLFSFRSRIPLNSCPGLVQMAAVKSFTRCSTAVCSVEAYRTQANLSTWAAPAASGLPITTILRDDHVRSITCFFSPLPPFTLFLHTMLRPGAVFFVFERKLVQCQETDHWSSCSRLLGQSLTFPNAATFKWLTVVSLLHLSFLCLMLPNPDG